MNRSVLLLCMLAFIPILAFSQAQDDVYNYVEHMPEFNGDLKLYMASNIHYPDEARKAGVEGRVVLSFVVNEDGKVSDIQVLRGISTACDEEAIRVVKEMPDWKPAKQNGKAVKVRYTLPVIFSLGSASPDKPKGKFTYVEQMPSFDGNMYEFISNNIHYPDSAKKRGYKAG